MYKHKTRAKRELGDLVQHSDAVNQAPHSPLIHQPGLYCICIYLYATSAIELLAKHHGVFSRLESYYSPGKICTASRPEAP
jgi:hypothetical protein